MVDEPGPAVFDLAKQIHGLSGVELQVYFKGTALCDRETLLPFQRAAKATGLAIPSLAGVWPPGASLLQPTAERKTPAQGDPCRGIARCDHHPGSVLRKELPQDGSRAIVRAGGRDVAEGIRALTEMPASRSGWRRMSLAPAKKRTTGSSMTWWIGRACACLDLDNVERYNHIARRVPGIVVLKSRIRQVHLKNENRLSKSLGGVGRMR